MLRYGMKYSTIRYWQEVATMLYRHNGIIVGMRLAGDIDKMSSREIGHLAIQLAHVAPYRLQLTLTGEMK